jgi:hypothetical protein
MKPMDRTRIRIAKRVHGELRLAGQVITYDYEAGEHTAYGAREEAVFRHLLEFGLARRARARRRAKKED